MLPTLDQLRALKDAARRAEIKALRITSYAQARKMRQHDKLLGLHTRWKIGDYYYTLLAYPEGVRFVEEGNPEPPGSRHSKESNHGQAEQGQGREGRRQGQVPAAVAG